MARQLNQSAFPDRYIGFSLQPDFAFIHDCSLNLNPAEDIFWATLTGSNLPCLAQNYHQLHPCYSSIVTALLPFAQ